MRIMGLVPQCCTAICSVMNNDKSEVDERVSSRINCTAVGRSLFSFFLWYSAPHKQMYPRRTPKRRYPRVQREHWMGVEVTWIWKDWSSLIGAQDGFAKLPHAEMPRVQCGRWSGDYRVSVRTVGLWKSWNQRSVLRRYVSNDEGTMVERQLSIAARHEYCNLCQRNFNGWQW